jgi:hypothetical protein
MLLARMGVEKNGRRTGSKHPSLNLTAHVKQQRQQLQQTAAIC